MIIFTIWVRLNMARNSNYCYTCIPVLKKHMGFDGRDTQMVTILRYLSHRKIFSTFHCITDLKVLTTSKPMLTFVDVSNYCREQSETRDYRILMHFLKKNV